MTKPQLLGIIRVSPRPRVGESPEFQRQDIETKAEALGGEIVEWVEDIEVSGADPDALHEAIVPNRQRTASRRAGYR